MIENFEETKNLAEMDGFEVGGKNITWESVICTEEIDALIKLVRSEQSTEIDAMRTRIGELFYMTKTHLAEFSCSVRLDEREACAKVCEKWIAAHGDYFAEQIRARSNELPSATSTAIGNLP